MLVLKVTILMMREKKKNNNTNTNSNYYWHCYIIVLVSIILTTNIDIFKWYIFKDQYWLLWLWPFIFFFIFKHPPSCHILFLLFLCVIQWMFILSDDKRCCAPDWTALNRLFTHSTRAMKHKIYPNFWVKILSTVMHLQIEEIACITIKTKYFLDFYSIFTQAKLAVHLCLALKGTGFFWIGISHKQNHVYDDLHLLYQSHLVFAIIRFHIQTAQNPYTSLTHFLLLLLLLSLLSLLK